MGCGQGPPMYLNALADLRHYLRASSDFSSVDAGVESWLLARNYQLRGSFGLLFLLCVISHSCNRFSMSWSPRVAVEARDSVRQLLLKGRIPCLL